MARERWDGEDVVHRSAQRLSRVLAPLRVKLHLHSMPVPSLPTYVRHGARKELE